jgi:hypothetical protein
MKRNESKVAVHMQLDKNSLSPLSQNVTSTNLNLFGPAVSERSLPDFEKKRLVASLGTWQALVSFSSVDLCRSSVGE